MFKTNVQSSEQTKFRCIQAKNSKVLFFGSWSNGGDGYVQHNVTMPQSGH